MLHFTIDHIEYIKATSAEEVVDLLSDSSKQARVLSGGSDLLVQLREGRKQADLLVDLKTVPSANVLQLNGRLTLGAAVPCRRIYGDAAIRQTYPALVDAASLIGGIQIQSRAGLGGNLCNASPAADSAPALLVLQAQCRLHGPHGSRELAASQMCTGPGQNALQPGEFLDQFSLPAPEPNSGAAFLRFIPRNEMDIAVANAAAWLRLDAGGRIVAARLALGAVAPTPILVPLDLQGEPDWRPAVEAARAACRPITDMRGSADQRRHLAGVLAERALATAFERARGASGHPGAARNGAAA